MSLPKFPSPVYPVHRGIPAPLAILVVLMMVALILPGSARADDEETLRQLRLVVTANTAPVHRPFPEGGAFEARQKFGAAIDEALVSRLESFLVEAGNNASPFAMNETYYDIHLPQFTREKGYAVVNQTGRDHIAWGLAPWGVRARQSERENRYIGAFNYPMRPDPGYELSASMRRDSETVEGGITFVSASGPEKIGSVSMHAERSNVVGVREALRQILEGRDPEAPRSLVVVFSELSRGENEALAREFDEIDLVIETSPGSAVPFVIGRTHLLATGKPEEIQILTLTLDDEDRIEAVGVERRAWIEAEDFAALVDVPKPTIGMSVRPAERVAQRLDVDINAVNLDVFRDTPLPDLTDRENVYVYRFVKDGRDYNVIRTHHALGTGWINVDVLVQIDAETNTIAHIETNLPHYPIDYVNTRMADVFRFFYNKPHGEWEYPAELTAGIELQADEAIMALRHTLVANERLYGGGQTD